MLLDGGLELECAAGRSPALRRPRGQLEVSAELSRLLGAPWTKNVEDQTDAFFCALIGYWHWLHRGRRTQLLGDATTGFILVPRP